MEFDNYYKQIVKKINHSMAEEKEKFLLELTKAAPKVKYLSKSLVETTDGGKRIRGFLVILGYELAGGTNETDAMKGALAYEIFQSSILIHDDIIDESPYRRGKPTIHNLLGNTHYAISQAICLGDIGFFWAIKLLSVINIENDLKFRSLQAFLDMMINTGLGEILDVELPALENLTDMDIENVHYLKTAIYSIIGPLKLGAIIANGPELLIKSIEEFGRFLGLAFQIKDDIIGIFNDENVTGKSTSSDIEEGKITYLYLYTLQNANNEDIKLLKGIYGKKGPSLEDVNTIRQIFINSGALTYCNKLINNYSFQAKNIISQLNVQNTYKLI